MKEKYKVVVISAVVLLLLGVSHPAFAEMNEEIEPVAPTARFEWNPEFPNCNQQVDFTSISIPGTGNIISEVWSFGETGKTASCSWDEACEYDVTLTVTADDQLSDSVTHTILVGRGVLGCEGSLILKGQPGDSVSDSFSIENICIHDGSKLRWKIDPVSDLSITPQSGELFSGETVEILVSVTFPEDSSHFTEDLEIFVKNQDNRNNYETISVHLNCPKPRSIIELTFVNLLMRYAHTFPIFHRIIQLKN